MLLPFFAPRAIERDQDSTEALCIELVDGFVDADGCDAAVVDQIRAAVRRVASEATPGPVARDRIRSESDGCSCLGRFVGAFDRGTLVRWFGHLGIAVW